MKPASKTDQGWAWVVLAASASNNFLNGAFCYFVGVVHAGLLRKYDQSATMTAWAGGIYSSMMCLGAPLASLVIGRFGCRICCIAGGILSFAGLSASSLATSIEQLFFTYGLVAGLGLCLSYSSTVVTIGYHFDKFRAFASGIAGATAAVGIFSGNLVVQYLMDEYLLSGAFLLAAAISLHHCLFGMFYLPTEYERTDASVSADVSEHTDANVYADGYERTDASVSADGYKRTDASVSADGYERTDASVCASSGGKSREGDTRTQFGSRHSLAIRGVEIKVTKSMQSLTDCDGMAQRGGGEDESGIPLLLEVTGDGEERHSGRGRRMDRADWSDECNHVTGTAGETEAAENSSQRRESLADDNKHSARRDERLSGGDGFVSRVFCETEGVVVGRSCDAEAVWSKAASADNEAERSPKVSSVNEDRKAPLCEGHGDDMTSQFHSSFNTYKAGSDSQDSPGNKVHETAECTSLQETASDCGLRKTSPSSSLQEFASSSVLQRTASSSSLQKCASASDCQKAASSSKLEKTASSSNLQKAASSSMLQKTASSSMLQKADSSSNLQKPASSSNLQKADSSSSLQKAASSSSLQKAASSSSLQKAASSSSLQKAASSSSLQKPASSSSSQHPAGSRRELLREAWEAYRAVLSNAGFVCYSLSLMAAHFNVSGVYLHLPEFAQSQGSTSGRAATLFVAVGVSSLLSRLATGFATTDERIDLNTMNMGLYGLCGLATLFFPFYSDTYQGQMVYSALFGLYTGGLSTLFSSLTVQFVGVRLLNTAFSVLSFVIGTGYIAGPLLAALILDNGGTYAHSFFFLGSMTEVAFLLNLAAGFFLGSRSKAFVSDVAVLNRNLMGSALVISVPESTLNTSL